MQDNCKICKSPTSVLFNSLVLNKYDVKYLKCSKCGFIQTEKPYWLQESYSSAISNLDIGLISRNINFSNKVDIIIKSFFDPSKKFLDYGGGYGMFVRLMRDKGFNFYRYDTYCDNLFAKRFDITDTKEITNYELVTSFEVFEHLDDSISEIQKMLRHSDSILFSTELLPEYTIKSADDWWYFIPETGQHIAFYTSKSLNILADIFNTNAYSFSNSLHLFTPQKLSKLKLQLLENKIYQCYIKAKYKQSSLLQKDYSIIRNNS